MELLGKVAMITGGARIGRAVAEALAMKGCHVAMVYRSSKKSAEETVKKLRANGVKGMSIQADVSGVSRAKELIRDVNEGLGGPDIVINMASVYEKTPMKRLGESHWQENMNVNLRSAYLLALAAAPVMRRRGGGRIINFADWIAASGRPRYKDYLPYYVSKSGVIGLTEALALELAPDILVNTIAPGPILSPPDLTNKESQDVVKNTPLGRWGGPEEIAKAVLFLIESDFVTGETIRVDGGRHLY